MDPFLQLVLDTMNQRFNELNTRLTDRDREFADHAASVDSRFTEMVTATSALKQCIAGLESIHVDPITATIEQWLLSLEANYVDRDADYAQRIMDLEAIRTVEVKVGHDARVAALEKAMAELAAWRPDMEGLVDDIKLEVQKFQQPARPPGVRHYVTPSRDLRGLTNDSHAVQCWPHRQTAQWARRRFDYMGCWIRGRHDLDTHPG
jgi:hypothetical protein